MVIMTCLTSLFSIFFYKFFKSWTSTHDLSSYFPYLIMKSWSEPKSLIGHHDISDFTIFTIFLWNLESETRSQNGHQTSFFLYFLKLFIWIQKSAIMTCLTSLFSHFFKFLIWIKQLEWQSWLVWLHYIPDFF